MKTKIISSFPGTGKSHLCRTLNGQAIEIECWEYNKSNDFPKNIVNDIKKQIGEVEYIFISTNNIVLDELISLGIEFNVFYPTADQKEDYLKRYADFKTRGVAYDFIGVMYVHWDDWLKEVSKYNGIILKKGEYLSDKIKIKT